VPVRQRLTAGFQMLLGTTLFATLRNERFQHARIALQLEGVLLKEVALRVC
jgi:AraC-like DNA-binding protein